jgi:hypothetical protein
MMDPDIELHPTALVGTRRRYEARAFLTDEELLVHLGVIDDIEESE